MKCMMNDLYGMLMMRGDLDILDEVLHCNAKYFKGIFVLDGTENFKDSQRILKCHQNIEFYMRDADLGQKYHRPPRDGARQVLLDAIYKRYGISGYIFLLHSDEMFYDYSPQLLVNIMIR